jgi:hypothetical protein
LGLRTCSDLARPCYLHLSTHVLTSLEFYQRAQRNKSRSGTELARRIKTKGLRKKHGMIYLAHPNSQHSKKTQISIQKQDCRQQTLLIQRIGPYSCPSSLYWNSFHPTRPYSIALRLGAKICQPGPCRCGGRLDEHGLHGLSWRQNAGRFPRHIELNHLNKKTLQKLACPLHWNPQSSWWQILPRSTIAEVWNVALQRYKLRYSFRIDAESTWGKSGLCSGLTLRVKEPHSV